MFVSSLVSGPSQAKATRSPSALMAAWPQFECDGSPFGPLARLTRVTSPVSMFLTNTLRTSGSAPGTSPSDPDWNTTRLPSALTACAPALESPTGVASRPSRSGVPEMTAVVFAASGAAEAVAGSAAAAASAARRSLLELNICGGLRFSWVRSRRARARTPARGATRPAERARAASRDGAARSSPRRSWPRSPAPRWGERHR